MLRTTQLRTYTIRDGLLGEWAAKWRDPVVPLRLEIGFEDTFEEADERYWASPKREALGLDPAQYLVGREVRVVEPVQ